LTSHERVIIITINHWGAGSASGVVVGRERRALRHTSTSAWMAQSWR